MKSQEIEQYLAELGAALQSQGIKKPICTNTPTGPKGVRSLYLA